MRRCFYAVLVASSVALGSFAASAQAPVPCSEVPACPDDGATPTGDMTPDCFCPRPASCPDPNFYSCVLGLNRGDFQWSCQCEPPKPEPPTPPPPPDPGFCGGINCPDGSEALPSPSTPSTPEGAKCLCPGGAFCTGHCADGSNPKALGVHCVCPDETGFCKGHICADGKPPLPTTQGDCVCNDGEPAPPIFVPSPP
jgi:hypothetical protein